MYKSSPDEMFDQASGLRRLLGDAPPRVLTVVGEGSLRDAVVIGIAEALVGDGDRVALVDENNSLAVKLGLPARHELADSLSGDVELERVILRASEHIAVLPAARGLRQLRSGTDRPAERIGKLCERIAHKPTFILCAAGPSAPRRGKVGLVGEGGVLLVVPAYAEGVTAAYGLLKTLAASCALTECCFLVGSAKSEAAAQAASDNIVDASRRFLDVRLNYCGFMPHARTPRAASTRGLFQRIIERTAARRSTPLLSLQGREHGVGTMHAGLVQ